MSFQLRFAVLLQYSWPVLWSCCPQPLFCPPAPDASALHLLRSTRSTIVYHFNRVSSPYYASYCQSQLSINFIATMLLLSMILIEFHKGQRRELISGGGHMFQPSRFQRSSANLPTILKSSHFLEKFLMKMKIWPKIKAAFTRYRIIFHTVSIQFTRLGSAIHCTAYLMFLVFSCVN